MRNEYCQWADICEETHLFSCQKNRFSLDKTTHLRDIVNNTVHHLAFERLEHNSAVASNKLCLTTPAQYHPFSYVQYGDNRDDVSELS